VIARSGGIALEERVRPLDITPFTGLGTALERIDRLGVAWVQPQYPLGFVIAGRAGGARVWARLTFAATVPIAVPAQAGVRTRMTGTNLTVCVPAAGSDPVRLATFHIRADSVPGPPPAGLFPPPMPLEGLQLTAMQALAGRCQP
jgi:hypothetical protein